MQISKSDFPSNIRQEIKDNSEDLYFRGDEILFSASSEAKQIMC